MPATSRRWTVAEVLALPDDGTRHELIAGALLVTPAPGPAHQEVLGRLADRIRPYVSAHLPEARAYFAPADITWDEEDLVQPDLLVVPRAEVTASWRSVRTLLLAVEVVSPGSARTDREEKRRLYQRQGVREYWVADPDTAKVEVWRPEDERPRAATDELRWRPSDAAPLLVIRLDELFRDLPA